MPYGSSRARMFYGAGDYGRALASVQMTRGYYPGGGFFDFVKKAAKVVGAVAKSPIGGIAGRLLKGVPILGTAISVGETIGGLASNYLGKRVAAGGVQLGPTYDAVKQLQGRMGGPGPSALPKMLVEAGGAPTRRRRRRKATQRRRSRSRRSRGDYGDDWRGNRPSRAKGSGQFLTRDGGRRRKRRSRRSGGGRVSFTTKSGKRVSFTAKGDGDAVA